MNKIYRNITGKPIQTNNVIMFNFGLPQIKSQMKVDPPFKFQFRVKYYVLEPGAMLSEEITRYQFVLQLKKDLFQQRLSCTFRCVLALCSMYRHF